MRVRVLFIVFAFTYSVAGYAGFYSDDQIMDPDGSEEYRSDPSIDNAFVEAAPEEEPPPRARVQKIHTASHRAPQVVDEDDSLYDSPKEISTRPSAYSSRLPGMMVTGGEKIIVINPNVHVWGAYSASGKLLRAGVATAGSKWCPDVDRPCKTRAGTFRIGSLGDAGCISSKYPLNKGGGAPMPYCMFFNGNQGLHGSYEVREKNISHGCVRVSVSDAEWIRFKFATIGTKVIVRPY